MAGCRDLTVRIDAEHEIVRPPQLPHRVRDIADATALGGHYHPQSIYAGTRLFAGPALLEQFGEPYDLAGLSAAASGPERYGLGHDPRGETEHLPIDKARLISSNAHIRLQAALAGHGVLAVTRLLHALPVEAGSLRRLLPDHVSRCRCMRCCRPANSSQRRYELSWMRWSCMPTDLWRRKPQPLPD
jgi:DNA-binding transcriptional LysR family regulator